MKIAFFILGKKGYVALEVFLNKFGGERVAFVIGARDLGVKEDWFEEIKNLCVGYGVSFGVRGECVDKPFDYAFAVGWKWIIENPKKLIVFHDSILPKYRGFAPLVNMLINGEREIGVTALIATNDYDKGDIIYQECIKISYPITISSAIDLISKLYAKLVVKVSNDLFHFGRLKTSKQDEDIASYSLWRDEGDYAIEWRESSEEILRFIDAVDFPYRGACTYLNGELVRIFKAVAVTDVTVEQRMKAIGKIIFMEEGLPVIVCGSGLVKLISYKTDNGKSMVGEHAFRSRFYSQR